MTQEQKCLLLKDLCARLPYGVYVEHTTSGFRGKLHDISVYQRYDNDDTIKDYVCYTNFFGDITCKIEFFKPYLFPLSSMTEEQKKEYRKVCELDTEILENHPMDGSPFPAMHNSQDWLDAHHFDYRGLIPMGLAIDATDKNIY